jgi:uroporphyrinogen-III decarboxylase
LRWVSRDTRYPVDEDSAAVAKKRKEELTAQDIYTMTGTGPSPFMELVEALCGPVDTYFLLQDAPDLVAEVLDLMHQDNLRRLRTLLPYTQADTFWMFENPSTTLLSPEVFREHCAPRLAEYANLVRELSPALPVFHMCGTLNALLETLDGLPQAANEAFTTRPVGDVSLAEGRKRMPSKTLIGGTNATLWLKPAETIIAEVAADLAQCPDRRRIFLTSAGVLPPPVPFEKARDVVAGLKALKT